MIMQTKINKNKASNNHPLIIMKNKPIINIQINYNSNTLIVTLIKIPLKWIIEQHLSLTRTKVIMVKVFFSSSNKSSSSSREN